MPSFPTVFLRILFFVLPSILQSRSFRSRRKLGGEGGGAGRGGGGEEEGEEKVEAKDVAGGRRKLSDDDDDDDDDLKRALDEGANEERLRWLAGKRTRSVREHVL